MTNRLISVIAASFIIFGSANAASQEALTPNLMARAQSVTAPAMQLATPLSSDLFIRNAAAVGQALDTGKAAQIYDAASAAMKQAVSKEAFVKAVAATNARTGRIVRREWGRVERLGVPAPVAGAAAPAIPVGNYVTVFLIARNSQGATHMEQISFRLDGDNQWRLAGVTTHKPEQSPR